VANVAERTLLLDSDGCMLPLVIAGQADMSPAQWRDMREKLIRHDAALGSQMLRRLTHVKNERGPNGSVATALFHSFSYCAQGHNEAKVFKGRHCDRSGILLCVRWDLATALAYAISRR
jgi:hypothetical protein